MTNASLFNEALETTSDIWESQYQIKPVRNIRMPVLDTQTPVTINALWTDGGLRPSSNNLAFLIQHVSSPDELERWKQRLRALPIRGGLLATSEELHLVQPDSSKELVYETLDLDAWRETLVSSKPHLFTPKALSQFRQGQLSLADLEETVSERSFTFLTRQQAQIEDAFQKGIDGALRIVEIPQNSSSSRSEIRGHIIRYAIAYLAARILQDKNFFGSGESIYSQDQDPRTLLNEMVRYTNGFFKRTMEESDPHINELIREQLAHHMGVYRVSFALTDHRDVGSLYERAIKRLPPPKDLSSREWGDLNRHYTPVKIAERMLEALPLERLRPEERYIFDPAAGSGSLLLAATSRLADMTDIPTGDERKAYLRNYVAGNDLDQYADLIAQLRYFIASESLGKADKIRQIADVLPFPSKPNFTHKDYEKLGIDDLPIKPKVIVANPPFIEEGKTQKAAKFVQKALEWLDEGSQFAFVLPQSFLTATTHGISEARDLISQNCQVWEVCQCPEGTVGIDADQDVCLIMGQLGKYRKNFPTSARAIFSRAQLTDIRERGFLGESWISTVASDRDGWLSTLHKFPSPKVPTIPLGNLFFVFSGVTPDKRYPPINECPPNTDCKLNWRMRWRVPNKLWANPQSVNPEEKFIRYGEEFLLRPVLDNEELLDQAKVMVGRITNRGSARPLTVQFDTEGLCPDNNIFCVVPVDQSGKYTKGYEKPETFPDNWHSLTLDDKKIWLVGILASDLANEFSLLGRSSRQLTQENLCRLPLPLKVDSRIINITRQIIQLEQEGNEVTELSPLLRLLNEVVEESYGNPVWISIQRTGVTPELEAWKSENKIQAKAVIGQILETSEDNNQVYVYISRLMDDDDVEGVWIPLPQELPGWALDGTPFEAELSHDVKTFEQLKERPWALRKFRHEPRAYLTGSELDEFLRIPELELPS